MDLMSLKNDSTRKNFIRNELQRITFEALKKELGNDKVIQLERAITLDNGADFSKGDILVNVGEVIDNEGFQVEAVAVVSTTSKGWNTVTRGKKVTWADILDTLES